MTITEQLQHYAKRVRAQRAVHPEVSEPALAPAFQQLLTGLLPLLPNAPALTVIAEYQNPGAGRPDIALKRQGEPARAFLELKALAKPANPERWRDAHDKRQYVRLQELAHWATSNFADFHLFHLDQQFGSAAIVPEAALNPTRSDTQANKLIAEHDHAPFITLLVALCAADAPAARDAAHLAELMAHSARLVRGIVQERLGELHLTGPAHHPLLQVRQEFRDVLYAHPEAAGYSSDDFDALFSAAFAQTLAFGLLLVREGTGQPVDIDAWEHMPAEHPLMRTALRVLSMPEVVADMGIGFEVMRDTVNSFAPEIMQTQPNGRDPILYFYEDFLQTFDPAARERYGVYYTPIEVVRYMAGALDRALRDHLGTQGLRDPAVTILDPATGTGTFLLGIAERVRAQVEADAGDIEAAMALRDLASRMYGFELLVGPYAVAHYRLHHALRHPAGADPDAVPVQLPRLGVYLTDTLAEPGAAAPAGPLGFVTEGIQDERREANRIKSEQPILAIIGNPPYKRLEEGENATLVGQWMDGVWDDLKAPVRNAGQGGQLNTFPEFSVAFWRWAIWKLFEADNAPQKGVIAFISNRKFLTGWPYAGLRQMLRQRFDRIEIIDLRGDVRAGPRGDVDRDTGVFNIMVGTAITLAIADGSKTTVNAKGVASKALADVRYTDCWPEGLFSRRAKLDWLLAGADAGKLAGDVQVDRGLLDDMRPTPFQTGDWLSLRSCFDFASSGVETKRDHLVYGATRQQLLDRIGLFLAAEEPQRNDLFNSTSMNPASRAHILGLEDDLIVRAAYRPLERRWHYSSPAWNDRLRTQMQAAWGATNLCLFAMPNGTKSGPATWCHPNIPDRHAFRGSYGGYAFPLHDRRAGPEASNVSAQLIESLSIAYGTPVSAPDVFDAMLCLLSASTYTRRFAEDLEDVFPHIPVPADPAVFTAAVAKGREIRAVETFARDPKPTAKAFAKLASATDDAPVAAVTWRAGEIALCGGDAGRITGIPAAVWDFAVSGYRLLPRWIEGRIGLPADLALVRELRDVAARIAELIELFGEADTLLDATLGHTLTRAELGFDQAEGGDGDAAD
jgi:hypothetical protein